ncbi:MAG: hypothetical protein JOZ98_04100 [Solirubrobacterales bacterium]|nr:hypothetical protein [Solirubrobacterales bacterium]
MDTVLGNLRVRLLRLARGRMQLVTRAPTTADLAGEGGNYYVDLSGDPLDPACTYARDFAAIRRAGRAPAVACAHIARQPDIFELAVEYWFYYYFNQFNDLHEGDWEGMQIAFDATTPAQALSGDPHEIVLFQHAGGGEHANWHDA